MPEIAESVISQEEEEDDFGIRAVESGNHHQSVKQTMPMPQISNYQSIPQSEVYINNPLQKHGPKISKICHQRKISLEATESESGNFTLEN